MYGYDTAKWYPSVDVMAHESIGLIPKVEQSFGLLYKNGNPATGNMCGHGNLLQA